MTDPGIAAMITILFLWGIFGIVCSVTCAIYAIKQGPATWYRVAGWVVIINIALTVVGFLTR